MKNFNTYSNYYNLLYADKDYEKESNYIHSLLTKYNINKGDILELGSGTGRHGCLLAQKGYQVCGIERSSQMISQVVQTEGFKSQQGNICSIEMGQSYDAIISLFHVISYQTKNTDIQSVFKTAYNHLKPQGLFIFDFWYSPAVTKQRPEVRIKRISNENINITRIAEPEIYPNKNVVDVKYTIFIQDKKTNETEVIKESHPMRHFSLPEIDIISEYNGFKLIQAEEFLTSSSPGEDTWAIYVVLKRI